MVVLALTALFAAAAAVAGTVFAIAWRRRAEAPGFGSIALVAAGAAWWSAASTAPLFLRDHTLMMIGLSVPYLGVCLLVAGWWATARALTDRFWTISRRATVLLAIEPVLCLLALATNPWHHQFIQRLKPTVIDGALAAVFGPLFWVHTLYSYVLIGYSAFIVIRVYIRETGRYRGYLLVVLTSLPSGVINMAGILAGGRIIDLTAVGFAMTAPVIYWLVARQSMPALAPVAHQEVIRNMDDAVIVLDPGQRLVFTNPAANRFLLRLGLATEEDGRVRLPERITGLSPGAEGRHLLRDVHGSGIDFDVRVSPLRDGRGKTAGAIMVARDVTEQNRQREQAERANEQLRTQLATIEALRASLADQAARDYLTGLFNRRHLMGELTTALRAGAGFAIALIDIDHFKRINDGYGHNTGDDVLTRVAGHLVRYLAPGDVAARYGGEEFALLLHGVSGDEAAARVDDLRRTVAAAPIPAGAGPPLTVTFSAGVAVADGRRSAVELIHEADVALYTAKTNGRNRVERATTPVRG
ncbi:GGDEF domain-containing protein [Actinoplanes subglobosus]|uniref:Diguanylate cyclase n=1 Tax=Actinoplanes subglobosus TaxID=1547892 RepID=A0ABV8IUP1_9ACTN